MTAVGVTLGIGSGINTTAMVEQLAAASRAPRDAQIEQASTANNARISALAKLRAALDELRSRHAALADDPAKSAQAVAEGFVAAYNSLLQTVQTVARPGINGATAGPLSGQSVARGVLQAARGLLLPANATSLAALGITTQRDGTLLLDPARLASAVAADPTGTRDRLGTVLKGDIAAAHAALTGSGGALTTSDARYRVVGQRLGEQRERVDRDTERLVERLTRQLSAMDRAVSASKAQGAFMTQQVALWSARN